MARLNDLGQGKLEGPKIDPRVVIIRQAFNYRDTSSEAAQKHIDWLTESIRERGVDDPIWVEYDDGKVYLIDGECRLLALRRLWDQGNEVRVPAIAFKGDEAAILAKSMISNGALPPSQLEFGNAAERLLAWGWTLERIAALTPPHLGLTGRKAKQYVKDAVELQQAPLAVKDAVAHGIEGVAVSPALALSATRKGRLMAPEVLKKAAGDAKAAGKATATRPKGAGVKTRAAQAKAVETDSLLKRGDRMAELILAEGQGDWDALEKAAKSWQKARA
jgi:ParB-like chromosome segregation protein Spo0J